MPTITYTLDQVNEVAKRLLHECPNATIFTFTGSLGAGKTTLVQAMLRAQGVSGIITSPTFTYVNVYAATDGTMLYHFDCYRIQSMDDFLHAGFDEYLHAPKSMSFIEWPEIIMPLLKQHVCHVTIDYAGSEQRTLSYTLVE